MLGGSKEEVIKSKADACTKCGMREMASAVLCTKYGKWMHGSCEKIKRVSSTLAKGFICERYNDAIKGIVEPAEVITFYDQVELVKSFR